MNNRNKLNVTLCLYNIQLPETDFDLDFYTGKKSINELRIANCVINRITADRGEGILYKTLKQLRFSECKINDIADMAFFYMRNLYLGLYFDEVDIGHISPTFFTHTRFLHELQINRLSNDLSLNDLFNGPSPTSYQLSYLEVCSSSPKFRLLAAANFSALVNIKIIRLNDCGIEIIESNTFELVYKTLRALHLSNNKITNLDYKILHPLIEELDVNIMSQVALSLKGNPLICSCNFYEFQSIFFWIFNYDIHALHSITIDCVSFSDQQMLDCFGMQTIHANNICINNFPTNTILYPKFAIKRNEEKIIVNATIARKYRFWAHNLIDTRQFNSKWGYSVQKCLANGILQSSVRCFLFSNITEAIPLNAFSNIVNATPAIMQFCVNYVSSNPKKMWPLHCITVDLYRDKETGSSQAYLVFGGVVSLIAIVLAFVAAWLVNRYLLQPKETIEGIDRFQTGDLNRAADFNDYESLNEYSYVNSLNVFE